MKITLLQAFYKTGAIDYNTDKLLTLTRQAARKGADLCIAPELAICGPMPRDRLLGSDFLHASRAALARLAAELRDSIPLLLGSPMLNPVPVGRPAHNCAVLLNKGEVRIISRKVLLSNSDVFDEYRYFEPGMSAGAFDLNGWRLAVVMAEDTSNDPSLFNRAPSSDGDPVAECLSGGADALICLGAVPFAAHRIVRQENILAAIAARYRIPTVFVNHCGAVDGNVFPGMSSVFAHTGNMTALGAFFEEESLFIDISAPDISASNSTAPTGSAPAAASVSAASSSLKIRESDRLALTWQALVVGTRHFVRDNGFEQALIGISGGLDSALTAAVAKAALGAQNVRGVFMPSPYTSAQSREDAVELCANLGIELMCVPIDALLAAFEAALPAELAPPGVPRENIQARIRADILMALANKHRALLLNTSNKSELAVGYGTLYGDMAGAVAVLGDLYKTGVFELAAWYNRKQGKGLIPPRIIAREPSAELKENQRDTDSLPPYAVLDQILEAYIENNIPEKNIVVPIADTGLIAAVIGMLKAAEFKRAQAAPVIRLSVRGFGPGWRMPISHC